MELSARKTKIIVLDRKFTNPYLNTGHNCDIRNLSVLHIEETGRKIDALQILQVARAKKNGKTLLNEQLTGFGDLRVSCHLPGGAIKFLSKKKKKIKIKNSRILIV